MKPSSVKSFVKSARSESTGAGKSYTPDQAYYVASSYVDQAVSALKSAATGRGDHDEHMARVQHMVDKAKSLATKHGVSGDKLEKLSGRMVEK